MKPAIRKVARHAKSRTIKWAHLQFILGALAVALPFVNPGMFPDLPPQAYGAAAMLTGIITYILRTVTRKPLDERGDNDV